MPKICYVPKSFQRKTERLIDQANAIIEEYQAQGYDLTLRQIFYVFVSRDLIPNTQQSYKKLGSVINDARLAGLIDWDAIVDRTRNLQRLPNWGSPSEIIESCAQQFRFDRWDMQFTRVEVWIEKEALAGVFDRVCNRWDVPYFSCRGYVSQSEMWSASQRLKEYEAGGQDTLILHFGDHDPSGIDMTRDILDRLTIFGARTMVKRIALNMDQVREYDPPPNPAKITDSRSTQYIREYGSQSWELDALDPKTLSALVVEELEKEIDKAAWIKEIGRQDKARETLGYIADNWETITEDWA